MQDFSASIYLRQIWKDQRLAFQHLVGKNSSNIKLSEHDWKHIWTPDTYFENEKGSSVVMGNRLVSLSSTGDVLYIIR